MIVIYSSNCLCKLIISSIYLDRCQNFKPKLINLSNVRLCVLNISDQNGVFKYGGTWLWILLSDSYRKQFLNYGTKCVAQITTFAYVIAFTINTRVLMHSTIKYVN